MILNLINYTLDQNHIDFSIEETDSQLLRLSIKNKKFIIFFSDTSSFKSGRKDEVGIQLSVPIKHKLIGFSGEDYTILLLGYDRTTNTFTFWKYGSDIDTNTKQYLYSSRRIFYEAEKKGFAKNYIKKRNPFNKKFHQRSLSVSINAFLFPLIIKNHSKIFERGALDDFGKVIKRFNLPYNKDDLLLSLYLYTLDRQTKNIDKNDPELKNVSKLCRIRFKTIGFHPVKDFIPDKYAEKFRNENGIYTKIQNFKYTDPNVEGGYPGGAHASQKKIWDLYYKNNGIDKKKLKKDAKDLSKRILSKDIGVLIGKTVILDESKKQKNLKDVLSDKTSVPEISDFDLNSAYKNRVVNPDNFSDRIESLNLIDKSNELHEITLKKLAKIFENKKLPTKKTQHIDFYSQFNSRGKLFEVKTFNDSNFNQQIRHGIIQLREYYFAYAKYWKKIPIETDLFLLFNKNPEKILNDIQLNFLVDQKIKICWINNENVVGLNGEIII